jgi:hypothetical protein
MKRMWYRRFRPLSHRSDDVERGLEVYYSTMKMVTTEKTGNTTPPEQEPRTIR